MDKSIIQLKDGTVLASGDYLDFLKNQYEFLVRLENELEAKDKTQTLVETKHLEELERKARFLDRLEERGVSNWNPYWEVYTNFY